MKVFVTVGTTRFDSLIKYIDETFADSNMEFVFQIADGKYEPKNFPFFNFSAEVETHYKESDIVVCHAGAGTIYKLLEIRKKIIIVPNTERIDNHQLDIADFMKTHGYAITIKDFSLLSEAIQRVTHTELTSFDKHNFNKTKEIMLFSLGELEN